MTTNCFQIRLATAYPGAQPVPSSKGATLRAEISTDQGLKDAYIKLIDIDGVAKEALCAVLARKLQLPMLQPYYVQVDPSIMSDYCPSNIHNIAFGIEADEISAFRLTHLPTEDDISGWSDVLRLAVFDEWIYNRDRIPNNLIFHGKRHFRLIDHDEALPNYASPGSSANAQLLQQLARNKSELERHRIRKKALVYIDEYKSIDWNEIHKLLLTENLPGSAQIFRKYIRFLAERSKHMHAIITESLDIKQQELNLSAPDSTVREEE